MASCIVSVHNSFGVGFHPCGNPGKVEYDGVSYCGIHDPVKVKARREKIDAKHGAKPDIMRTQWRRNAVEHKACEGIPTEALEDGVVKDLLEAAELIIEGRKNGAIGQTSMLGRDRLDALEVIVTRMKEDTPWKTASIT